MPLGTFARIIAASALTTGLVAPAMAQVSPAACGQYKTLFSSTHDQVKALAGNMNDETAAETVYLAKTQLEGFVGCKITLAKSKHGSGDYWGEHYQCSRDFKDGAAANAYADAVYGCTKDLFSARKADEAFFDGGYKVVGLEGDVTYGGRDVPVKFGSSEYLHFQVSKNYQAGTIVNVNIWYSFLK